LAVTMSVWRARCQAGAAWARFDPDRTRLETVCSEFGAQPLGSLDEAVALAQGRP